MKLFVLHVVFLPYSSSQIKETTRSSFVFDQHALYKHTHAWHMQHWKWCQPSINPFWHMSMALTLLPWQQFLPDNNCGTADTTTWAFIVWCAAEKWNTRFVVYPVLPFLLLLLVTFFFLISIFVLRNMYCICIYTNIYRYKPDLEQEEKRIFPAAFKTRLIWR